MGIEQGMNFPQKNENSQKYEQVTSEIYQKIVSSQAIEKRLNDPDVSEEDLVFFDMSFQTSRAPTKFFDINIEGNKSNILNRLSEILKSEFNKNDIKDVEDIGRLKSVFHIYDHRDESKPLGERKPITFSEQVLISTKS
jgi:hypothetical protein